MIGRSEPDNSTISPIAGSFLLEWDQRPGGETKVTLPSSVLKMRFLQERQLAHNQSTRHNWESFKGHRERIMNLIQRSQKVGGGKIAVLGAGNCNDLDLKELASSFQEIHLFDLDRESMADAVARQCARGASKIQLHDEIDLSGRTRRTASSWPEQESEEKGTDEKPEFDLVISTCVLSQIMETVGRLSLDDLAERELMLQVRDRHLGLMSELVAPGGAGVVVTDMSSSGCAPDLSECPEANTSDLMRSLIRTGSCFTGLSPGSVSRALEQTATIAGRIKDPELTRPWLWQLDEARRFLVYALSFTKSGDQLGHDF